MAFRRLFHRFIRSATLLAHWHEEEEYLLARVVRTESGA